MALNNSVFTLAITLSCDLTSHEDSMKKISQGVPTPPPGYSLKDCKEVVSG